MIQADRWLWTDGNGCFPAPWADPHRSHNLTPASDKMDPNSFQPMKSGAAWQRPSPQSDGAPVMEREVTVSVDGLRALCHAIGYQLNRVPAIFAPETPSGRGVGMKADDMTVYNQASTIKVMRKLTEETHQFLGKVLCKMLTDPEGAADMVLEAPDAVMAQLGTLLAAHLAEMRSKAPAKDKDKYKLPGVYADAQAAVVDAGCHRRHKNNSVVKCEPVVVTGLASLQVSEWNAVCAKYAEVHDGMSLAAVLGTVNNVILHRKLSANAIRAKMGYPPIGKTEFADGAGPIEMSPYVEALTSAPTLASSPAERSAGSSDASVSGSVPSSPQAAPPASPKRAYACDSKWERRVKKEKK